jgi:hypothetical protein
MNGILDGYRVVSGRSQKKEQKKVPAVSSVTPSPFNRYELIGRVFKLQGNVFSLWLQNLSRS